MKRTRILFLCTGNSCRSQMAEGWARHLAGDRWVVASAGTHPVGLNPLAMQVMAEAGVDIARQRSKGIEPDLLDAADVVITLCGHARDRCPVPPSHVKRLHWPIEDPVWAAGREEEVLDAFRRVRDEIGRRVEALLEE